MNPAMQMNMNTSPMNRQAFSNNHDAERDQETAMHEENNMMLDNQTNQFYDARVQDAMQDDDFLLDNSYDISDVQRLQGETGDYY